MCRARCELILGCRRVLEVQAVVRPEGKTCATPFVKRREREGPVAGVLQKVDTTSVLGDNAPCCTQLTPPGKRALLRVASLLRCCAEAA